MHWNESNPAVPAAREVAKRLRSEGYAAYWVGGCVRDALLGLDPHDIDIATDAPPESVRALFPHTVAVGAHFGVVLVLQDNVPTEVATFRTDGDYLDGRRPTSVTFGSAEEDARRRDFTINSLFHDPVTGETLDFVGGREDLEGRVLRAIGDPAQRFEEDALRLLRAVRFAVRFSLEIEPGTLDALRTMAPTIQRISPERIREELVRIFTGPRPGQALRLLDEVGLLGEILPEVAALKGVPQPEQFHPEGDVFVHTGLALDALAEGPSPTLAFATLLHDIGKPETLEYADRIRFNKHHHVGAEMAEAICRRLRFSNTDRAQIVALVETHMRFMDVQKMRRSRLRRLLALDRFDEHLELHRVDCVASHGATDNYEYCRGMLEEFAREDAEPVLPPPLLTGRDLIARGYQPGPRMGEMLDALREAQLDDEIATPEAALEWIAERYAPDA